MDTLLCNDDGDIIFFGAPSATDEVLAFHYGNFDDAYGDGTVGTAAANGRVYADTVPATLPTKFGIIEVVGTASGQTTYTWTPPATSLQANVLVVAGGGGGGGSAGGGASGAGGGAGGLIFDTDRAIPSGQQTIVVGDGGTAGGSSSDTPGGNGGNSSAFTLTAVGGGGGGSRVGSNQNNALGRDGGSGGGEGSHGTTLDADAIGEGTAGQGNDGGLNGFSGNTSHNNASGGGGGASSVGGNGLDNNYSGDGGAGFLASVFGETYGESGWFAGGGGGGRPGGITDAQGLGGLGGGGDGGNATGVAGAAHTGGGGGGAGSNGIPARGGSGVVAIRYIVDMSVIIAEFVSLTTLSILQGVSGAVTLTGVERDVPEVFSGKSKCVLVASVAIDQNTEGIIYEAGATGAGFALYATSGTLYCQGGKGDVVGGSVELSYPIPSYFSRNTPTEIGISVEVLASTSRMRMFVNRTEVAQTSTNMGFSTIAGSNNAGSGQVYEDLAVCRITEAQGTYTDTIYTVNLYPNVYIEP